MNRPPDNKIKNNKKLPVVSNVVEGVTCFSVHGKYNVDCQRTGCKNWIGNKPSNNCVLIAAQEGPRTLQDIGKFFNLTRMRICQIEKSIYGKIKVPD